jgi:tetratricopeptide (TPR) repeat protein
VPTQALADRARQAGEKAVALAPNKPDGYAALGGYERLVKVDLQRAAEQYERGRRLAPGESRFLFATAQVEQGLGRWEASVDHLRQAERLNPLSVPTSRVLGTTLLRLRRYPEAREALDRALALAPKNLDAIEYKVMTLVADGDLPGARAVLKAALKVAEPTEIVAAFANYYSLGWVLEEEQRDLLLRLTPSAFDDDRGHWATCLAEEYARRGDVANTRKHAEEAAGAFTEQLVSAPDDAGRHAELGMALALLGRKEEAIREGERSLALEGQVVRAVRPAPARRDLHPRRRAREGARPARASPEDALLPLARLAEDRPHLRSDSQEPTVPEIGRRRDVDLAACRTPIAFQVTAVAPPFNSSLTP